MVDRYNGVEPDPDGVYVMFKDFKRLTDENMHMRNGINRVGGMALIKASHEHIRQACVDALDVPAHDGLNHADD